MDVSPVAFQRPLTPEERVILFRFCWDHSVAEQSHELSDRADVLLREAEVAISKLREAMRHMISGA